MLKKTVLLFVCVASLPAFALEGDDLKKTQAKAMICQACHGVNGKSSIPGYPHLAGQNEQYIVSSLRAYKSGARNNPLMSPMAAPLSDEDISLLAKYYAQM